MIHGMTTDPWWQFVTNTDFPMWTVYPHKTQGIITENSMQFKNILLLYNHAVSHYSISLIKKLYSLAQKSVFPSWLKLAMLKI